MINNRSTKTLHESIVDSEGVGTSRCMAVSEKNVVENIKEYFFLRKK